MKTETKIFPFLVILPAWILYFAPAVIWLFPIDPESAFWAIVLVRSVLWIPSILLFLGCGLVGMGSSAWCLWKGRYWCHWIAMAMSFATFFFGLLTAVNTIKLLF